MSTIVEAPSGVGSPRLASPQLRPLRFEDHEQTNSLLVGNGFSTLGYEDWSGLWIDNPLWQHLGKDFPIGWVLERDGAVVGILGSVPTLYKLRGEDLVSVTGLTWFVEAPYRGFALQLLDEYFSQPADLFINTSVGGDASVAFSQLSSRIPLGDWQTTSYWVTSYRSVAEKALRKWRVPMAQPLARSVGAALRLRDAGSTKRFPQTPGSLRIESVDRFDSRFDVFWGELLRQNRDKLMAQRDSKTLSWHFAIPMRKERLWIFAATRNQQLRAYCALTLQDHVFELANKETKAFRGMRVADYQSLETDVDLLPSLLKEALRRCAAERIDFLENLGSGVPKMRVFDECAPYQAKLDNWKFVYHVSDPALDEELRRPDVWDPSAFDGDASLE